ncbi:hypothetical protein DPMN_158363 [Dreissena polymorpha]|uniref:Uncharacterized protein n=1 Tax=Dreissena polymorpha TaxID=45954 RepID=A0A9D4ILX3_DREPO|nr:hypothetical protein DPMN_158363 [Dreissena polymorpha]
MTTNLSMSQSIGKYIEVTLHEKLLWNSHVGLQRANNSLSFLRKNISNYPTDVKD